jgi:hypothetical protein
VRLACVGTCQKSSATSAGFWQVLAGFKGIKSLASGNQVVGVPHAHARLVSMQHSTPALNALDAGSECS